MPAPTHRDGPESAGPRRRLRAIFAADIANFSGQVSVSETLAYRKVSKILRNARKAVEAHNGQILGMPGDGLLALFESAVDAVHCALAVQEMLAAEDSRGMRLRIGVHLGEVLFEDDVPFGESINVAARLEALADPGGILVSGAVVDAVSARVAATFEDRGVPRLKNIPRRIATFSVAPAGPQQGGEQEPASCDVLDRTTRVTRKALQHTVSEALALDPEGGAVRRAGGTCEPTPAGPAPRQGPASGVADAPTPARHGAPPGAPGSVTAAPPAVPAAAVPTGPPRGVDRAVADFLTDALAVHIGPVARVIVARALKRALTVDALLDELAAKIPSEGERQTFRASVGDLRTREG
jgi:class 3 adenylate cyclase